MSEIDKIVNEMKKAGFPLEVVARTRFEERGWEVRSQVFFHDKEENKSRYVDLAAIRAIDKPFHKFTRLNYTVMAECKKSDKPWVFYTPSTTYLTKESDLATIGYLQVISKPQLEPREIIKLLKHNHYVSEKPVDRFAVASYVPFTGDDQIFTATNQVLKGLQHQTGWLKQLVEKLGAPNILVVYYPSIIFDGKMYEYVLEKEEPKLTETRYVKYDVAFHLESNGEDSQSFLIDVVTKDFLPEYIDMLEREFSSTLQF
jgi:hypothetical protein